MKQRRRDLDIFSLSFLDIVSCGFGAVVLLVLISPYAESPLSDLETDAESLLQQVLQAETLEQELESELAEAQQETADKEILLDRLKRLSAEVNAQQRSAAAAAQSLREDIEGLELVQSSLERQNRTSISQPTRTDRDVEVGGIPVDSEYVVFIVDTSGSMKEIWGRVTAEVENTIRIHPKIKGFQILNDNGRHLLSGYAGRWIPDTPGRRANAIKLLKSWNSTSNSSPVEGLEVALKRYANPNTKLAIYIFGDEYSGSSYDPVINALDRLNSNRINNKRLARVHAIGFLSNYSKGRFATLMREVTRRNNGTFVALPR